MGSLEKRIEALEGRIGLTDPGLATERRAQALKELIELFDEKLAYVSPRVESGELGLADMERESLSFAAAIYITLRFHGDGRTKRRISLRQRRPTWSAASRKPGG